MTYLTLALECECGRSATSVQEIGLTNDHQLILRWRCPNCRKHAYVLKPLEDCWKDCPSELELADMLQPAPESVEESDAKFMQAIGVKFPD